MSVLIALVAVGLLAEPTSLNLKVVEFARSKLGQRVGSGQCTALAAEALRHAGARLPRPGRTAWGEELRSLRDARPGDILQFEDAVFVRRGVRVDGAAFLRVSRYPHHTAVVGGVRMRGRRPILVILHQNVVNVGDDGADEVVQEGTISMSELRRGIVKAYRPRAG